MQLGTVSGRAVTLGWLIAVLVFLLAVLGMFGVLPFGQTIIFGLIAALALARLI